MGKADGWFQLERTLLRDPSLKPIPKLVLQDLLDRTKNPRWTGKAGTTERAADLGITLPTLLAAEAWLESAGYLLRLQSNGRRNVYLARYPAVPVGHGDRPGFEAEFSALCGGAACKEDLQVQEETPAETCQSPLPVKNVDRSRSFTPTCKADLQDSPADTFSSDSLEAGKNPPISPQGEATGKPPRSQDFTTQAAFNIAVNQVVKHYREQYPRVFVGGKPPAVTERAKQGVRSALKAIRDADSCDWLEAETEGKRLIDLFLADDDPFVANSGHDLSTLPVRLQALRQGVQRTVALNGRHPPPPKPNHRTETFEEQNERQLRELDEWRRQQQRRHA